MYQTRKWLFSQYTSFYCITDQRNTALVNIRDLLKNQYLACYMIFLANIHDMDNKELNKLN